MFEQEVAAIIHYVLSACAVTPYYWEVPQDFSVPAVYFPTPEVEPFGDTLHSFGLEYALYVKFFASTTEDAHRIAMGVLKEIREYHNLIPLYGEDGNITDKGLRINDPQLRRVDSGAVQLVITWRSRRPYHEVTIPKMTDPHFQFKEGG